MLRGIMWSWSQGTGGFFYDKTLCELWPPRRAAAERDGQWSAAEWKMHRRLTANIECPAWYDTSVLQQLAMLFLILVEFQATPSPTFNCTACVVNSSSFWWVFLLYAASADRIIPRTCFQGWPGSFSPSVTRWSDPVYMQTYSLTPPFTAIQSVLLTPYCEPTHQSDGVSPSLPSRSWSSLCHPPDFDIHLSLIDSWCCCSKVKEHSLT